MLSDSRNIRGEHISRIDTPGVKEDIWSIIDTASNVRELYEQRQEIKHSRSQLYDPRKESVIVAN